MERERLSHPSFGMIGFSRVQGSAHFYGSELEQDHYISCEIKTSTKETGLSSEYYYGDQLVVRLRMTSGQFSEMITSMNKGCGVPCTLEFVQGSVEKLPELENRKKAIHRKFKERMGEFAKSIEGASTNIKQTVKKKSLSVKDVTDIVMSVDHLTQEIKSNIPFFLECFQEDMDKVVKEAKMEIENAIQHKINVLGLEALHNQNKLLE